MLVRRVFANSLQRRNLQFTANLFKKTPFNLADIGEGISEVELIQW
jgi:hypothetical protein